MLLGRLFAPSLPSLFHLANGGGHAMHLYVNSNAFLDGLAGFFDLALRRGDATCLIATEDIRNALGDRLRARGWDTGRTSRHRYASVDAAQALGRFMRNGLPDPVRLAEIASELDQYRLTAGDGGASRLTIFGIMASLLCAAGNAKAAVALENVWESVTRHLPFFTVCGYSTTSWVRDAPGLCSDVCARHWAVSHATGV